MLPANDDTGNTPLSPEEQADLIPDLATQRELNEWERENILEAMKWALSERAVKLRDPCFTERYVRELHGRMFNQTWKWAGMYRKSEKNVGVLVHEIRDRLGALIRERENMDRQRNLPGPTKSRCGVSSRPHADTSISKRNGRHARLLADVLIVN